MTSQAAFVFVHGGGQGAWVWAETIAALQQQAGGGVATLAIDLPGSGSKRHLDPADFPNGRCAELVCAEIEAAGVSDVVLVGHSAAGTILPFVAQLRPGIAARHVYVSCVAPAPGQSVLELFGQGLRGEDGDAVGWPTLAEDLRERWRVMFCNDMTAEAASAFLDRLGPDRWPSLGSLAERSWIYDHLAEVPSTYVICLQDQALPPVWQERCADRLYADRRVRLDAGHQAMNTRPHTLAEVLRQEARR